MSILLVEDETRILFLLKRGLEMEKYQVKTAEDGEEALQLAETQQFDLIILDIMLPKITGIEVAQKLRKDKNQTPILMLTARDTAEDQSIGLKAGANDYLVKPFMFSELIERIEKLIS